MPRMMLKKMSIASDGNYSSNSWGNREGIMTTYSTVNFLED